LEEEPDFVFDDELLEGGRERQRMSRRQKRRDRHQHWSQQATKVEQHPLDMTAETLQKLQQEDPSLDGVRRAAKGEPSTATGIGFFERDGLVYRQWTPPGMPDDPDMAIEQLVLPSACRNAVLKLAHEIPLAGHMGKTKTTRRVLQRFYWPTVYRDVAKFCRSCGQWLPKWSSILWT